MCDHDQALDSAASLSKQYRNRSAPSGVQFVTIGMLFL